MFSQLLTTIEITPAIPLTAAGTSDVAGASLDLAGCNGVVAVVHLGDVASSGTLTIKGQKSDTAAANSWIDIGPDSTDISMGDSDDGHIAAVEWSDPTARYFRVVVQRHTANSALGGAVYYRHRLDIEPAGHHGDVATSMVIS